jgi:hypothetical protein
MELNPTLAILLAASLPALGAEQITTLDLVDEAGYNTVSLTIDVPLIGSSSDTTNLSGSLQVRLGIDPSTDEVGELTILTGNVTGTGVTLSKSGLFGSYNVSSTSLGATLASPAPPGVVDPPTGNFDATQHTFTINSGTLGGSFTVLGTTTPIALDFATAPLDGMGSGTGNVSLVLTGSTPTSRSYEVTVLVPISISDSIPVSDDPGAQEVGVAASGTVKARGTVTIPVNPYEAWADANAIPGALFGDDANGDGVPNGLQWGLGLAADDFPFPHLLQPGPAAGSTVDFKLMLPPGGSAGALRVLVAPDPASNPFATLSAGAVSAGNPIPAGTSGLVTISLPKSQAMFLRLQAIEP